MHSSTNFCLFEIIYSFIPLSPLDLIALPLSEQVNLDGRTKVEFVKALHERCEQILSERMSNMPNMQTRGV